MMLPRLRALSLIVASAACATSPYSKEVGPRFGACYELVVARYGCQQRLLRERGIEATDCCVDWANSSAPDGDLAEFVWRSIRAQVEGIGSQCGPTTQGVGATSP